MTNWQRIGDRALRTLRLNSMSGKFLLFTVLATLFTTLAMALLLSGGNGRSVGDRVDLELRSVSSEVARAMGAWVDQHVFDLRLRASPYVVSDNLARASGGGRSGPQAVIRLLDYLNSVRQNLPAHPVPTASHQRCGEDQARQKRGTKHRQLIGTSNELRN